MTVYTVGLFNRCVNLSTKLCAVKRENVLSDNALPHHDMPDEQQQDTVSARLKEARFRTAARLREAVAQDRMAELVGKELGRVMHATQWRRYEGGTEPPLDVIRAVARVSGLSEGYLAFGTVPAESPTEQKPAQLAPTKSGLPLAPLVQPGEKKQEKKGVTRRRA